MGVREDQNIRIQYETRVARRFGDEIPIAITVPDVEVAARAIFDERARTRKKNGEREQAHDPHEVIRVPGTARLGKDRGYR